MLLVHKVDCHQHRTKSRQDPAESDMQPRLRMCHTSGRQSSHQTQFHPGQPDTSTFSYIVFALVHPEKCQCLRNRKGCTPQILLVKQNARYEICPLHMAYMMSGQPYPDTFPCYTRRKPPILAQKQEHQSCETYLLHTLCTTEHLVCFEIAQHCSLHTHDWTTP